MVKSVKNENLLSVFNERWMHPLNLHTQRVDTSDFPSICLSRSEAAALRKLSAQDAPDPALCESNQRLISLGFLNRELRNFEPGKCTYPPPTVGPFYVTDRGRLYISYLSASHRQQRRSTRRYWITTAIAIAALIKSFLPEILSVLNWLLKRSAR